MVVHANSKYPKNAHVDDVNWMHVSESVYFILSVLQTVGVVLVMIWLIIQPIMTLHVIIWFAWFASYEKSGIFLKLEYQNVSAIRLLI